MIFSRPVRRNRQGRFSVHLSDGERALLRQLPAELKAVLTTEEAIGDPALRRLFPPAYENDEAKAEEYRRLMQADLVERHAAALDTLERTAGADDLSEDETVAWMNALNQLRLVLGTRLDVTEDDDPRAADPEHQLYYYLGYLQEHVVRALAER